MDLGGSLMSVKFRNRVYRDKLNEYIKSGIKHPILIDEAKSIEDGGDKNNEAEFFCEVLHNQKEFVEMLRNYYKNPDLYGMFIRCDAYNEDHYKKIFDTFNTNDANEYFKTSNSGEPFTIINGGYKQFEISYNKTFKCVKDKSHSVVVFEELQKAEPDKNKIFEEMKRSGTESLAALFILCENESEEKISLFIERFLSVISEHAEKNRYFFTLKRFSILLLNEKVAPGIYDKYKLLFE